MKQFKQKSKKCNQALDNHASLAYIIESIQNQTKQTDLKALAHDVGEEALRVIVMFRYGN